jgi:hypothetical protein
MGDTRLSAFADQGEGTEKFYSGFRIGGLSVQLRGLSSADVLLTPPLEPFRFKARASDIDIQVEWLGSLPVNPGRKLFDSGSIWRLYENQSEFCFDFRMPRFGAQPYKRLLVDAKFRQATLQMSEECFRDATGVTDPLEYPLDELLIVHRLTQEGAIEFHSCGIVKSDGTGNLFVGHSGAGKSTTTRLWTAREDVEVLSDDRIIVRRDECAVETPCDAAGAAGKHGVPSASSGQALRLRDRSALPSGHFAQDDKPKKQIPRSARNDKRGMRMYGTPWHGEAAFASPGSAPLSRIFILEHGHGNVLTRLSPSQAVAELFARSFVPFHRHEYVDSALEFLQELVGAVPVYHYAFEPNEAAVERILGFRD